jgi:hypothetical protein
MPRPQGKATEGRMSGSVAPREVLARLRRGVAKPQVKPLIGVLTPTSNRGTLRDTVSIPRTMVFDPFGHNEPWLTVPARDTRSSGGCY